MKHLATILAVVLLMGCQTNSNTPKDLTSSKPVVIETDQQLAEKSQKKPTDDKKNLPEVEAFIVQKPVLCGPATAFLEGIDKTSKEEPIGFWIDSQYGNKIMLLRNANTGSISVLEFIQKEYACFLSVGQQSQMVPTGPTEKGEKIKFKRVLTLH